MSDSLLVSVAPRIAQDIGPLLLVTSEDTLTLVLETLSVVVDIEKAKWVTVELAHSIVEAVLQVWVKFNKGALRLHFGDPSCVF